MTLPLFDREPRLLLAPDAWLLRGFAENDAVDVLDGLRAVMTAAPLRNMLTPGGQRMSVA